MPEISIKHFIAYATFNNNGDRFHFKCASVPWKPDRKMPVKFTVDGCAVFQYRRIGSFAEQLAYFEELQKSLREEFGQGFIIAMAPESDCSTPDGITNFCSLMKKGNPSVTTIFFGDGYNYSPDDEKKRLGTLGVEWHNSPYASSLLINAENNAPQRQSSTPLKLVPGVDYASNGYKGVSAGYDVIDEILGNNVEATEIDHGTEDDITINPEQVAKIQEIADKAFYKVAGIKYDPPDRKPNSP